MTNDTDNDNDNGNGNGNGNGTGTGTGTGNGNGNAMSPYLGLDIAQASILALPALVLAVRLPPSLSP